MSREISDDALFQATRMVRESMLESLPASDKCRHEFSAGFNDNMAPLLAMARQRRKVRRYMQRVAAIFVAVLLSLGTWLSVDTRAGATLPEGYVEVNTAQGNIMNIVIYKHNEDTLYFRYYLIEQGVQDEIFSVGIEPVSVRINGISGEFFEMKDPTSSNELIWIDEAKGIGFGLSGFLDQEKMQKIAESVLIN